MRAAIVQSSYIPWKGYFDLIHAVDTFIFFDDVQFTTRDWRTRNRIKAANGPQWLTIPVGNRTDQLIHEVEIKEASWQRKHWASIRHNYGKAPFFKDYEAFFAGVYLEHKWPSLSEFNQYLVRHIATEFLGITTEFRDSREFQATGKRQDRLISLLQLAGASHYVSGPSARSYIDPKQFEAADIELSYHDYPEYPAYPQLYPPFEPAVSILDLLFNTGPQARHFIWGWRG
ncbi:WbqC family protein [Dyella sp. EPa41]|uniref:WbqC family protein n=1 Tax=Dyella sp. EPa41 TaxID=1561194 RepID=UPI001916881F|nr:WbqC family protein [Dyella sp. EPa41]